MAKRNIFKEAKSYRKQHPNTAWQDCVAKVSSKNIAGVKKAHKRKTAKRVGVVVAKAPVRAKRKRVAVRRLSVVKGVKPMTRLQRGTHIIGKIDNLEKKYAKELNKDKKFLLASEINLLHDKLDVLKKAYRRA